MPLTFHLRQIEEKNLHLKGDLPAVELEVGNLDLAKMERERHRGNCDLRFTIYDFGTERLDGGRGQL